MGLICKPRPAPPPAPVAEVKQPLTIEKPDLVGKIGEQGAAGISQTPSGIGKPTIKKLGKVRYFMGTWDAVSGRGNHYDMVLKQEAGGKVAGTYSPRGGQIDGTASGTTLTFNWSETVDGKTVQGTGTLTAAADGKSFAGDWRSADPPDQGTWAGTKK